MPFRDFLYLDTSLVQSIIAQLDKGLVTEFLTGKQVEGEVTLGLNLLQAVLPSLSGRAGGVTEWSQTKVLDDYAFEVAMGKLKEAKLLRTYPQSVAAVDDARGFLLVQGRPRIYDYNMFRRLLHEKAFATWFQSEASQVGSMPSAMTRQQRRQAERERLKQLGRLQAAAATADQQRTYSIADMMTALLDVFYGDMVLVRLTAGDLSVEGPLRREFLREDIITLTYKYGSEPQGTWHLLGLVTKVPDKQNGLEDAVKELEQQSEQVATSGRAGFGALSDALNVLLQFMNNVQMALGTVTHPNFGVTPIALYRQIGS